MGAGTLSKPSHAPPPSIDFDAIKSYSADQVAAIVRGFGAAYHGYGDAIVDQGIDGAVLCKLERDVELVTKIGIENVIHAKKIGLFFKSFKEKQAMTRTVDSKGRCGSRRERNPSVTDVAECVVTDVS
ncbi:Aste57867_20455 [Aphanomyces stellatus]|uniref:Aste57867_20455 protein n=1 Tax=Aphanomyces stellatus TaxID=120398 RepID=A0A485LGI5_9STRA|nr:hypothetical protein As57867_020389 [Aphanomyces stellatus]VFT97141.1 Aste57867_20455 [Aphanomyces stellatus]